MAETFELTGMDEMNANFQKLIKSVDPDSVEQILLKPAKMLADDIRARAPQGPTGNLKKSVVAKLLQRRSDDKSAPAIVAIHYRYGPHAHLVEYGHAGPKPAPAHPFFRPGWDVNKRQVEDDIKKDLTDAITRAVP